MNEYMKDRVGKFRVSRVYLEELADSYLEITKIFRDMVVLKATYLPDVQMFEYIAIHPNFLPKTEGEEAPMYKLIRQDGHPDAWHPYE